MRISLAAALLSAALVPAVSLAHIGSAELGRLGLLQVQALGNQPAPGSHLGIEFSDIGSDRAQALKLAEGRGVEVIAVEEGSPADKVGLQPGDVLLSYNGESILGAKQLIRLVQETPSGRKVKVQIWRAAAERLAVLTTSAPAQTSVPPSSSFSFSEGTVYPRMATIIPRPLLAWRDILFGMEFEELDAQLSEYFGVSGGVLIRAVEKGSPASKSGLKAGDVIVAVQQKPVLTAHDFASCLRRPGPAPFVSIVRNHKKLNALLATPASDR